MAARAKAKVHLACADSILARQCEEALQSRGLHVECHALTAAFDAEVESADGVLSIVLETVPSAREAAALADRISKEARRGKPPILLIARALRGKGFRASLGDTHAAILALLRARGAIVLRSPEVWLESAVLLAAHGVPAGPQGAIVAAPSGWLALSAAELQRRAELIGERFSPLYQGHGETHVADFVLTDAVESAPSHAPAMPIPVGVSANSTGDKPCLLGLANALAAAESAGQASLRIAAGDGPARLEDAPKSDIDSERFERQLDKLQTNAGDHECKVLLSSYSVPITRQAVATTPSAATRIAKKAGYPVQIKAWGPDQPTEPEGALVHVDVGTAADVRRSFSAICSSTGCEAVIIRETPFSGREVRIEFRSMGEIGLVCFLYQRGRGEPAAALAPLRPIDARAMARHVVASRATDLDPDWEALESLLINTSHLVAATPRVVSVELTRVIVGNQGEGALVVDARARLLAD